MKKIFIYLFLIISITSCKEDQKEKIQIKAKNEVNTNPAREIIEKVVNEVGTMSDLKKLNDVEYDYYLDATNRNIKNVSKERYIFNGELSWAQYLPEKQFPIKKDTITQGYNGDSIWVKVNQSLTNEPKKTEYASFIRKTNFYWFTMMQKLLDNGVHHELLPSRVVNSIEYQIVQMTFDNNIGEVQDKYLLYINPSTNLIDQFLFTVKGRNLSPIDPLLMVIEYDSIEGIKLMAKRVVKKSNWDGKSDGEIIYRQHYENIKFNNGFTTSLFEK